MGENKPEAKKWPCFIGLHTDKIHKELPLNDLKNNVIGVVIVNRCANCGRIKSTKVRTVDTM